MQTGDTVWMKSTNRRLHWPIQVKLLEFLGEDKARVLAEWNGWEGVVSLKLLSKERPK